MRDSQGNCTWNTISSIVVVSKSRQLPSNIPSAQDFLEFFIKKVEAIRKATAGWRSGYDVPPSRNSHDKLLPAVH